MIFKTDFEGDTALAGWSGATLLGNGFESVHALFIERSEEHDWDWLYHCYSLYDGWSVRHDEVREHTVPAATPTDRENLLREWFAKNQKP